MQARSATLRRRLTWLIICVVGVAVTPIAGVLAWRDGEREVALETARLTAAARLVASTAADPAAQGNVQDAFHALRSIGQMRDVEYGRIEAPVGKLLVETGSGVRLIGDTQSGRGGAQSSIFRQLLSQTSEVTVPVVVASKTVGQVVLLGRTEGLLKRFLLSLGESLAIAVAAVLVGLSIAFRLQERIARPIVALTDVMRDVQETHDFGRNVEVSADGEVAALVAGFNRMLSEIRVRDSRIAEQMAGLEGEVTARTAELVVARDAAEAANSAKSDFLATMSHEIRTPMNGVMAMAELLAAGDLPTRERRFAEVIVNSGASLLAIINDILDFSKIEAGKLELESVRVDLNEIVDDVLSLFWERALSKGLDLAAIVHPRAPQAIAGDPVRLRQVICNLVNNAIKFSETGGVLVEIVPDPSGALQIAVQDTGIGIPEDKIATVFGAFSQADQSTTRRFGGTGLGLAICKKLVDAMGGELRVTSRLSKGSRFTVVLSPIVLEAPAPWPRTGAAGNAVTLAHRGVFTRQALEVYCEAAGYAVGENNDAAIAFGDADSLRALPGRPAQVICLGAYGDSAPQELLRGGLAEAVLAQPMRRHELAEILQRLEIGEAVAPAKSDSHSARAADTALPQFVGSRVLVADDSPVNREVAMEALQRLGVAIKLVTSGAAAIEAAESEHFDAILMDGSMPEMDGYDAARAIRRNAAATGQSRVPIIALTAHVVGAAAEAWRDADMDAVLHKPFTLKALAAALGRFLVPAVTDEPDPLPAAVSAPLVVSEREDLFDPEVMSQLRDFAANGRRDFVDKVIDLYVTNAPRCVADLQLAVGSGCAERISEIAHALKSMSYSIGAKSVAAVAAELETTSLDGTLPANATTDALETLLCETLAALEARRAPHCEAS